MCCTGVAAGGGVLVGGGVRDVAGSPLYAAFSSSVLLLVPPLPLLLVLQRRAQLLDEHREHLVQRVHHAALQPLGDGRPGVVEAKLLQDVVDAHRVDLPARPRDEPEGRAGRYLETEKYTRNSRHQTMNDREKGDKK